MASVGVIGSGTWGTSLAILLNGNGHKVQLWSAVPAEVESLSVNRKHPNLGDTPIPEAIEITGDLKAAMKDKDLLVLSVPSVYVRQTAAKMKPWLKPGQIVTNVAKGIEEATLKTLSEVIEEELPEAEVTVLSGPSHAEEVSRGLPTTCVAGAHSKAAAEYVQSLFMSPVFRVYTSPDMLGIELGGKPETFSGLTGIGDLIVTCASMHSRNRRAGILIGKGYTMDEAMKEVKMVVEGVYSAKAALKLAEKYHVTMPIVEQVNEVLFDGKSAKDALAELMLRDKRMENTCLVWDKE